MSSSSVLRCLVSRVYGSGKSCDGGRKLLLQSTAKLRGSGSSSYRAFSAKNSGNSSDSTPSYSAYEYPLAKEPPQVTRTTAMEAVKNKQQTKITQKSRIHSAAAAAPEDDSDYDFRDGKVVTDPFDDEGLLTPDQRKQLREQQSKQLNTKLQSSVWPITPVIPPTVPSNVPANQLTVPTTVVTTLSNGVRVVSQETYGQVSTVGVVCELGSRLESAAEQCTGTTNLLEMLAFGSCSKYSAQQVTTLLQDWGGQRFVSTGREQSLHCIDLLRPNVDKAMELLHQVLLTPQFSTDEVEDAKRALAFQALDLPPELTLGEALQEAAYGPDQQLGQPHFCPSDALPNLTATTVRNFWQRQFLQNPYGLVIGGAGVEHEFLVEQAEKYFGHLQQDDGGRKFVVPSQYRGGEKRVEQPTVDGLIRIAIGFEVGGWHSPDLVATCVLQTLLGGGSSFSAGGPGKGMYSRLYRQVLNQFSWAEAAEAYTAFHNESGLWGISGSTFAHNARDMVQVFTEHLAKLAVEPVSDEELDRARNMLKCNVLTQLESRLVLFEDMGRQVLTYGQRECMHVTCEKIAVVTKEEIQQVAIKALQQPPTITAVGENLKNVPHHDEIVRWL